MNEEELTVIRRELQRSECGEVLGMLETNLSDNLNALLNDLDELLVEPKQEHITTKKSEEASDPNPFTALFDFSDWFGNRVLKAGSSSENLLILFLITSLLFVFLNSSNFF